MIWLFIYVLVISLYDLQTHRIPNWYTIPVIAAGLILHFPGSVDIWLASFIVFSAWTKHWMGAGDAKLWLALFWILPVECSSHSLFVMSVVFLATGGIQILWRFIRKQSVMAGSTPAAWRTIPFVLLAWYVH